MAGGWAVAGMIGRLSCGGLRMGGAGAGGSREAGFGGGGAGGVVVGVTVLVGRHGRLWRK